MSDSIDLTEAEPMEEQESDSEENDEYWDMERQYRQE